MSSNQRSENGWPRVQIHRPLQKTWAGISNLTVFTELSNGSKQWMETQVHSSEFPRVCKQTCSTSGKMCLDTQICLIYIPFLGCCCGCSSFYKRPQQLRENFQEVCWLRAQPYCQHLMLWVLRRTWKYSWEVFISVVITAQISLNKSCFQGVLPAKSTAKCLLWQPRIQAPPTADADFSTSLHYNILWHQKLQAAIK